MCQVKVDGDDESCHHDEDEEGGVHLGHCLGVKPRHVSELRVHEQLPGETLEKRRGKLFQNLFAETSVPYPCNQRLDTKEIRLKACNVENVPLYFERFTFHFDNKINDIKA